MLVASLVEKSYLTLKLTFDLVFTKSPELLKLTLIGYEFSTKKSMRNTKKTLYE